ncbi:MAG: BamA/TamA family outer membrane protein [bacterium]
MIPSKLRRIVICLLIGISGILQAQEGADTLSKKKECQQEDVFDLLWKNRNFLDIPSEKKLRFIAIPVISYAPTTGFQLGAGASVSWPMGRDSLTRLSAGIAQAVWTTEKQVIVQLKSNIYTYKNRWFIQTDWRLYIFRLATFGLSTGCGTISYPMLFNWVKFHNVFSRQIIPNLYAGIGYHLDYHYSINDETLDTTLASPVITPHYTYSIAHGFNPGQYTSSGLSANFVYDTRDNIINAYKGFYVNVNYRYDFKWLGSQQNGSRLWTEFRTYVGLSKTTTRNVLAFWFFGNFKISGEIPYLDLMSSGFDQMNSSGRGYKQGRWRGEDFVYGEVEYRFPISPCTKMLGGVLFLNMTTSSSRDEKVPLFGYLKPGGGFGLRIMVGKYDRTNLCVDVALGENFLGFYLQATDIF